MFIKDTSYFPSGYLKLYGNKRLDFNQTLKVVLYHYPPGWWMQDLSMYSIYLFCLSADFYKGKTVFKHWLPGMCYRNITFQLISEATVFQTALVTHSDITHTPLHHRTGKKQPSDPTLARSQARTYLGVCSLQKNTSRVCSLRITDILLLRKGICCRLMCC